MYSALADPMRIRFLEELSHGDQRSGSEVAEKLGISLALLCHHSKILVDAGIVEKQKVAQTTYYRAKLEMLEKAFGQLVRSTK